MPKLHFFKRWIAPIISIVTVEWLFIQLWEWHIGKESVFLNMLQPAHKFYIISSIGLIIYLLWIVILFCYDKDKLKKEANSILGLPDNSAYSLALILKNAYQEKRWSEVIKIGNSLSEPLWYTGKFLLRMKIGELVVSASAFENKYDIQAETYIDDLGWTNCRLRNKEEALKNIKIGLKIAENKNNHYLIAKANRHFADISLSNKKYKDCVDYLKTAYFHLKLIGNPTKKTEMNGNLEYTVSKYYFAQQLYGKAIKYANYSLLLYKSIEDTDREVKMYNLKGKIFLADNKEEEAIFSFQEGLTLATRICNIVNIVSNSASLAECYCNNGRYEIAENTIAIAKQNSNAMDDPILIEKINQLSIEITQKKNSAK